MKQKIILKSTELFSNLGFKSVTMDDIAREMGISKKTIYQYFSTKTKLVEAVAIYKFDCIGESINLCFNADLNPVEEILKMKIYMISQIKNERPSAEFQFKKYYPKMHNILKQKKFDLTKDYLSENLQRGIDAGYYRDNLNIDLIFRIFFSIMVAFKDDDIFPKDVFSKPELLDMYLDYHLRGICTNKGLEILNNKTV